MDIAQVGPKLSQDIKHNDTIGTGLTQSEEQLLMDAFGELGFCEEEYLAPGQQKEPTLEPVLKKPIATRPDPTKADKRPPIPPYGKLTSSSSWDFGTESRQFEIKSKEKLCKEIADLIKTQDKGIHSEIDDYIQNIDINEEGLKPHPIKVIEIDEKKQKIYLFVAHDGLYVASYIGNKGFKLDRISWRDTQYPCTNSGLVRTPSDEEKTGKKSDTHPTNTQRHSTVHLKGVDHMHFGTYTGGGLFYTLLETSPQKNIGLFNLENFDIFNKAEGPEKLKNILDIFINKNLNIAFKYDHNLIPEEKETPHTLKPETTSIFPHPSSDGTHKLFELLLETRGCQRNIRIINPSSNHVINSTVEQINHLLKERQNLEKILGLTLYSELVFLEKQITKIARAKLKGCDGRRKEFNQKFQLRTQPDQNSKLNHTNLKNAFMAVLEASWLVKNHDEYESERSLQIGSQQLFDFLEKNTDLLFDTAKSRLTSITMPESFFDHQNTNSGVQVKTKPHIDLMIRLIENQSYPSEEKIRRHQKKTRCYLSPTKLQLGSFTYTRTTAPTLRTNSRAAGLMNSPPPPPPRNSGKTWNLGENSFMDFPPLSRSPEELTQSVSPHNSRASNQNQTWRPIVQPSGTKASPVYLTSPSNSYYGSSGSLSSLASSSERSSSRSSIGTRQSPIPSSCTKKPPSYAAATANLAKGVIDSKRISSDQPHLIV